jgi:hypothetical protein
VSVTEEKMPFRPRISISTYFGRNLAGKFFGSRISDAQGHTVLLFVY